jgi:hypothetical protein
MTKQDWVRVPQRTISFPAGLPRGRVTPKETRPFPSLRAQAQARQPGSWNLFEAFSILPFPLTYPPHTHSLFTLYDLEVVVLSFLSPTPTGYRRRSISSRPFFPIHIPLRASVDLRADANLQFLPRNSRWNLGPDPTGLSSF